MEEEEEDEKSVGTQMPCTDDDIEYILLCMSKSVFLSYSEH